MKSTLIISLCVVCMLMTTAMFAAGYSSWNEYKSATSQEQIGKDIIGAINNTTTKIATTTNTVYELVQDPLKGIANIVSTAVLEIKEFFEDAFKKLILLRKIPDPVPVVTVPAAMASAEAATEWAAEEAAHDNGTYNLLFQAILDLCAWRRSELRRSL